MSRGRVFTYNDSSYDPLEVPLLRIRPIDGGQKVPFLIRTVLYPRTEVTDDSSLGIVLPMPVIFKPTLETRAVWVGRKRSKAVESYSPETGAFSLKIPITAADFRGSHGQIDSVSVLIDGVLTLRPYDLIPQRSFGDIDDQPLAPHLTSLTTIMVGRDYRDTSEADRIKRAAREIVATEETSYDKVVSINRHVGATVRYLRNSVDRMPAQILEERVGDCHDRSVLMVALLRSIGVLSRQVTGYLYDFNRLGLHAWVEVALPTQHGEIHWFIADPTAVSLIVSDDPEEQFVHFQSRLHMYPIQPVVTVSTRHLSHSTDILLNAGKPRRNDQPTASALNSFVDGLTEGVIRQLEDRADALVEADLMIRRELPLTAGSRYVLAERPIAEGQSLLVTVLEHQERLSIELAALREGSDLHGEPQQQVINSMRSAYEQLNWLLFDSVPAHHSLDLTYSRDPRTDRLQAVRLAFGRYLFENYLGAIAGRLRKEGLMTESDSVLLETLHDSSGGANLYYLQERALHRVRQHN